MIAHTISLSLGESSYPIYVGQQIFSDLTLLLRHIHGKQVFVVTQEKLVPYIALLQAALASYQCDFFYLPDGEQFKTLAQWQKILETLIQNNHERSTTLIAFGGGVVGDITGFAAACYQRGVNYLQIPTTLIAQVDAAIGGKTAVNHPSGKNRIGAFHQPQCVIVDIDLLKTLPEREYVAGLAEVIKYGLIYDTHFFNWLEENRAALLARNTKALLHAVHTSAHIKSQIVSQDERDQDLRNVLNFGHTFGHALEVLGNYQRWLHGEAVAMGMMLATRLSGDLGLLSRQDVTRIVNCLHAYGFASPSVLPPATDILKAMQHDKKVRDGKINFILLTAIGRAEKIATVTKVQLQAVLESDS